MNNVFNTARRAETGANGEKTAPIYFDHHATTPVDQKIADLVLRVMTTDFGNANSTEHRFGETAAHLVSAAREAVADLLGASVDAVHFTSGSTESIHLALDHAVNNRRSKDPLRVAASTVEHHAVLGRLSQLADSGLITLSWLPVDNQANLRLDRVHDTLQEGVDLVCVMGANNEVGTTYPIQELAELAQRHGADILVDATQSVGHTDLRVEDWGLTYVALSAHKIYGPKGIGALVTQSGIEARQDAGAPGTGLGTPNVPGIVGLGEACRLLQSEAEFDNDRIAGLRDRLQATLVSEIDRLVVNGAPDRRLPHNLHFSVPGLPSDAVIARLHDTVALSSGAACASGTDQPSHVLQAMGLAQPLQEGAFRIGLGRRTTKSEVDVAAKLIIEAIKATASAMDLK
jgi:cysteine desulfurase